MKDYSHFSLPVVLLLILFLLIMGLPSALSAAGNGHSAELRNRRENLAEIRLVLEKRIGDKVLAEKAVEKLSALSANEIELLSSLCERISHDSRAVGADLAFFLITTLIIFS